MKNCKKKITDNLIFDFKKQLTDFFPEIAKTYQGVRGHPNRGVFLVSGGGRTAPDNLPLGASFSPKRDAQPFCQRPSPRPL